MARRAILSSEPVTQTIGSLPANTGGVLDHEQTQSEEVHNLAGALPGASGESASLLQAYQNANGHAAGSGAEVIQAMSRNDHLSPAAAPLAAVAERAEGIAATQAQGLDNLNLGPAAPLSNVPETQGAQVSASGVRTGGGSSVSTQTSSASTSETNTETNTTINNTTIINNGGDVINTDPLGNLVDLSNNQNPEDTTASLLDINILPTTDGTGPTLELNLGGSTADGSDGTLLDIGLLDDLSGTPLAELSLLGDTTDGSEGGLLDIGLLDTSGGGIELGLGGQAEDGTDGGLLDAGLLGQLIPNNLVEAGVLGNARDGNDGSVLDIGLLNEAAGADDPTLNLSLGGGDANSGLLNIGLLEDTGLLGGGQPALDVELNPLGENPVTLNTDGLADAVNGILPGENLDGVGDMVGDAAGNVASMVEEVGGILGGAIAESPLSGLAGNLLPEDGLNGLDDPAAELAGGMAGAAAATQGLVAGLTGGDLQTDPLGTLASEETLNGVTDVAEALGGGIEGALGTVIPQAEGQTSGMLLNLSAGDDGDDNALLDVGLLEDVSAFLAPEPIIDIEISLGEGQPVVIDTAGLDDAIETLLPGESLDGLGDTVGNVADTAGNAVEVVGSVVDDVAQAVAAPVVAPVETTITSVVAALPPPPPLPPVLHGLFHL